MTKLHILQNPNKALRKKSSDLTLEEISLPKIRKILRDMHDTLTATDIGVGLASAQVGHPLRTFLVLEDAVKKSKEEAKPQEGGEIRKKEKRTIVFINPKIIKASGKKEWMSEGCLSVDGFFGLVRRSQKVTVEALDAHGKKFIRGASGLFAQIIQHEIDHLNGILFIDSAKEIRAIDAQKTSKKEQKYNE